MLPLPAKSKGREPEKMVRQGIRTTSRDRTSCRRSTASGHKLVRGAGRNRLPKNLISRKPKVAGARFPLPGDIRASRIRARPGANSLLFSASSHTICFELSPVNFCFKWRHRDGSTVEFNRTGWRSDDPLKADWLSKVNQLSSSGPAIPPGVRNWLQEECELIEVSGPNV